MNADVFALCLVMRIDFVLKGLEQFVFGAHLPKPEQPVRGSGWRHKRANDATLDHTIEIACPGLQGCGPL